MLEDQGARVAARKVGGSDKRGAAPRVPGELAAERMLRPRTGGPQDEGEGLAGGEEMRRKAETNFAGAAWV